MKNFILDLELSKRANNRTEFEIFLPNSSRSRKENFFGIANDTLRIEKFRENIRIAINKVAGEKESKKPGEESRGERRRKHFERKCTPADRDLRG